jgi:plastocyanin
MNKLAAVLAFALLSAGLFGCGGTDDSTSTAATKFPLIDNKAGDSHVRYVTSTTGDLAFRVTEASGRAGKATVELVNSQSVAHDLAVEAPNGKTIAKTERVSEGIVSTPVVLKPGEYVVYCTVPGHRKAGMKGHLTVWRSG